MKTVYNVRRSFVRTAPETWPNTIWISIEEPDDANSVVNNPFMDKLPHMKIAFWDVSRPIQTVHEGLKNPPSTNDAKQIVDFLLKYPEHDVVVNCAMGVSRSGAIAQFCQDFLGYNWDPRTKSLAVPNSMLYRLMVNYYCTILDKLEGNNETGPSTPHSQPNL